MQRALERNAAASAEEAVRAAAAGAPLDGVRQFVACRQAANCADSMSGSCTQPAAVSTVSPLTSPHMASCRGSGTVFSHSQVEAMVQVLAKSCVFASVQTALCDWRACSSEGLPCCLAASSHQHADSFLPPQCLCMSPCFQQGGVKLCTFGLMSVGAVSLTTFVPLFGGWHCPPMLVQICCRIPAVPTQRRAW